VTDRIPPVLRPEHPSPRSLSRLIDEFELEFRGDIDGVEITGVTLSTGDLHPGDLYVGVRGAHSHGAQHAQAARDGGAVAIMTDAEGVSLAEASGLPIIVVDSPRAALGDISAWVYRTLEEPPALFAITGTNGKTSVAYLLEAILKQLGLVTGLSSTAERHIGDISITSKLTTPEAPEMHALLARMRESAVRAVVIEVSAQALSRHRVDGIVFDVAGFTNLSHDHLDDYGTMEDYFQAKLALFDPERARRGVVSLDSEWGQKVVDESRIPVTTLSAFPDRGAQWLVTITEEHSAYTEFVLSGPEGRSLKTRVPVIGWHMAANAAMAILMLVEAGFELEAIAHALQTRGGIDAYLPGRTERVSGDTGPSVYVDFGHSADAFERTLTAVRKFTPGKIIIVFGVSGDRDKTKRPGMARVAAQLSDVVIVTDHHPRFEDPHAIRATLVQAAREAAPDQPQFEIADPKQAIRHAVSLAGPGDTILWAGPGHQDYRDVEGVRVPYSARDEARAALREAGWDA
jgi:UDP-N-acetylmuramoyl-L-alanyl-D-glutamate--2,6-diaminopimelate ligase